MNLPIYGVHIEPQKMLNLSLEHLHSLHLELRSEMRQIRLETDSITWTTWSLPSLIGTPLLCIIVMSVCYLIWIRNNKKTELIVNTHQVQPTSPASSESKSSSHQPLTMMELFRTEPQILEGGKLQDATCTTHTEHTTRGYIKHTAYFGSIYLIGN